MIYALWTVIICLTFIIQGSISISNITLNLTVILVFYVGIRKGEIHGMLFGCLIGIIEDTLTNGFFGPHLISKGFIGYLVPLINRKFFIWTPLLGIINIFTFTFIDCSMVFILKSIFDKIPVSLGTAFFIIIIQSLINAPLGIFLKPKEVH